ncbi:unnamed protein product, partial [marine sediment metagenome]
RLVDAKGKSHRVIVPKGMMSDIVKPLWENKVRVTGMKVKTTVFLQDIQPSEDDTDLQTDLGLE